jgi:hypothetical protein
VRNASVQPVFSTQPDMDAMEMHDIGFCKIIVLRGDIAEVIFNEGVHLTPALVQIYHARLDALLQPPFSLLINKIHRYTYDPLARWDLGTNDKVRAFAIVAYDDDSRAQSRNTGFLLPKEKAWNMRLFGDRNEAWEWLLQEQDWAR